MEDELRKVRLDIDALNSLLRKKNVFSVTDVDYAIFETDGSLSIMKKEAKQTLTKSDIHIDQTNVSISLFQHLSFPMVKLSKIT